MKKVGILIVILSLFCQCQKDDWGSTISTCTFREVVETGHSKAPGLQSVMDRYVDIGIPGISVAVYTDEGFWVGASGYAKIEGKIPMQPCHLQFAQSVSKTYMAVAILRLYEMGKITLDAKISDYLPANISSKITNSDKVTVRMLLNHTSGIAEYNSVPKYVTYLLQHPLHKFTTLDYINYIEGKPAQFEPGTKYAYTNTNYELLALIGDYITGGHAKFIRDEIFNKIGAKHSFYHENDSYLDKVELVNTYWDRYSNSTIENCSGMHRANVASLVGDDGIIATPYDFVLFLKALFSNQLLSGPTLNEMLTFVKNPDEENSEYGLGIHKELYNGLITYGHSGGGIGAGCFLTYFPEKGIYFFVAINIGTSVYSPIFDNAEDILDDFYDVLIAM